MSKRARRILVTAVVLVFAALIAWTVINGRPRTQSSAANNTPHNAAAAQPGAATQPAAASTATSPSSTQPSTTTAPATTLAADDPLLKGLRGIAPGGDLGPRDQPPQPLGSLDPRTDSMRVHLSRFGAGITKIEFSNLWQSALAQRQAERYLREIGPTGTLDPSRLPQDQRYVLVSRAPGKTFDEASQLWLYSQVPVFAARWLVINGHLIDMISDDAWSETAPGVFESRVENADGQPIARVTRRYHLGPQFDLGIDQRIVNLTAVALDIGWQQYGPVDLPIDPGGYIERRRLHFGTLPEPKARPELVLADDNLVIERGSAVKMFRRSTEAADATKAWEARTLWPTTDSAVGGWELSWFGTTNRYFGLTVHPPVTSDRPIAFSLGSSVATIEVGASNVGTPGETMFTTLHSATVNVAPGAEQAFDIGVYSGPLKREVLSQPPYSALRMAGMIIYSMSGCCTFLTFQWLAHLLLWFLSFLHDYIFRDWGMAIIGLVIVVRTLLHPLTKKSQINMQRFGKQMQALKPEIDKLQKKFGGDPKRMQQEQMRLMREHHINPLQMLGCLPMFLQMPIWIALWAMLYLAFDIRQQPAFYGVFQMISEHWPFLADLSSPDSFIPLGKGFTVPLVGWHVPAVNLLPILMGVVFFIQQKYMTPPTTANMTPEQVQQQKIMKWMMVILFPLMMYKSPSGLTLYIMTSSIIGILESRYVRRHIDQMDLNRGKGNGGADGGGPNGGGGPAKPKKPKDSLARAWADRLESMRKKQRLAQQDQKSFKKRK